jgi:hypothetical protein
VEALAALYVSMQYTLSLEVISRQIHLFYCRLPSISTNDGGLTELLQKNFQLPRSRQPATATTNMLTKDNDRTIQRQI